MAEIKDQIIKLWQNFSKKERYLIAGAAIILFSAIILWSYFWGARPDYVTLYTSLEAKDAGDVVTKLKESKVNYRIENNGSTILVPEKDVHRLRLELASQGLPRGHKGFEIFEQSKFGVTEFQNKVYYLQALQGELTRTIEQMEEVEKARVHIVMAEDSLYKANEKPATASVMLRLKPGAQLNKEQIKGIVNLVAHSIQGLKSENITIVDQNAKVLNEQEDANQLNLVNTVSNLELTKKTQEEIKRNIQSLLEQVLGPNKAVARVNVELNFDQRTIDRQIYEPVVDEKGILRSSQDSSESYKGTGNQAPGGVPGTASNIPGYVMSNNNGQSNYDKKDSVKNYEINETREKVVSAMGSVKRLTVAVIVDSSVTQAQQESLTRIVASAVGLNQNRGDNISIESIPFNTDAQEKQRLDAEKYLQSQDKALWIKIGAVVLLLIVIYFLYRRFVKKKAEETPDEFIQTPQIKVEEAKQTEPTPAEREIMKQRADIEKIAKSKPDDVAQLIKVWLADE